MKLKTSTLIWTFVWCIFMGITVGSIGIGAAFPDANLIAKPFVCPSGQMRNSSDYYQVSPVESVTTITWYCVDAKTGAKTELGIFPMSLYAGTIYGLLLFVAVFIGMLVLSNRQSGQSMADSPRWKAGGIGSSVDPELEELNRLDKKSRSGADASSRMKELKELRASNSITAAEYEQKRTEILKDL